MDDMVELVVQTEEGLTEPIASALNVKQGCPLSPLLFGLYIDRLADILSATSDLDAPSLDDVSVTILCTQLTANCSWKAQLVYKKH